MIASSEFHTLPLNEKIQMLYEHGEFIMNIRYYEYKINLYLLNNYCVEVFYNHKKDRIERIEELDYTHSRIKFYLDQIHLSL